MSKPEVSPVSTSTAGGATEPVASVKPPRRPSASGHAASSQIAAFVGTLTYYPLDVVRMRYMSQDGTVVRQHNNSTYHSLVRSITTIYREEGLRALYRGAHVAVMGSVVAWGSYMYLYRASLSLYNGNEGTWWGFYATVVASVVASTSSAMLTSPLWLIKTRMQLEERHLREAILGTSSTTAAATSSITPKYTGFLRGAQHVIQTSGIRGLWVGSYAQVLLGIPNALNFPIYDALKRLRMLQTGKDNLSVIEVCGCSTASKTILAVICHPLILIKTRLQDQRSRMGTVHYTSLTQAVRTTLQREGLRGMYRGIVPSLAQAIPRSITQFVVYELSLSMM